MKLVKSFRKLVAIVLVSFVCVALFSGMLSSIVYADPTATVTSENTWGDKGQIVLSLSGCSGYETITVTVRFAGQLSSASGWGFDTYTIDGNQVIASVSASGSNSWAFDSSVGIEGTGSNITDVSLVSITGSGSSGATTTVTATTSSVSSSTSTSSGEEPTTSQESIAYVDGDDWLTTDGDRIVDMSGNEVWLTGVNWFGYNTGTNIFDGCWSCSMESAIEAIADHGFNLLRIPMSSELLLQWKNGEYPTANFNQALNPELVGLNSLEIFDYALELCRENGIKVMVDIHCVETDAAGHIMPLWYTDNFTTEQYIESLDWLSERYASNDTLIAYDLKNEPHGAGNESTRAIWNDSSDPNNWRYVAELAGNTILDNNPNALIMIEGIQIYPIDISTNNFTSMNEGDYYNSWWGGNLRAVADFPVDFGSEERNAQIVYSPHDYGPAVYQQPWFYSGFTYESLLNDYWYDAWLYIDDTQIAPLLIGEWGGFMEGDNLTWMTYMRQLIIEYRLNHTFWCFNANSGDTGGLVLDDFTTWDEEKYEFVKPALWQTENGQFIGLDHSVPLGANGLSLNAYLGIDSAPTTEPSETTLEQTSDSDQSASSGSTKSSEATSADKKTQTNASLKKILTIALILICVISVGFIIFAIVSIGINSARKGNVKETIKSLFKRKK
ncbi:MAG TPA: glycoside hydrolase family 5 protein [Saccharofermentans sp.]|jgi:endoglucanase|nr:glycoside hydrolase family 5 protein [Saccharofermentans sp.]HPE27333.1 glycoside hydrolase family 5 protein [Saccharofermentans sp.]HPJ80606.1 glycoside hydrolase family 5 protein [Saccharofermentans sp.]HPQ32086.1 glycoside hydrolase family 5 protein [Saccharofermentans sp.]HRV50686.1 glycoside hydrolase family 5 protein [Saccharofermentans sp.]